MGPFRRDKVLPTPGGLAVWLRRGSCLLGSLASILLCPTDALPSHSLASMHGQLALGSAAAPLVPLCSRLPPYCLPGWHDQLHSSRMPKGPSLASQQHTSMAHVHTHVPGIGSTASPLLQADSNTHPPTHSSQLVLLTVAGA